MTYTSTHAFRKTSVPSQPISYGISRHKMQMFTFLSISMILGTDRQIGRKGLQCFALQIDGDAYQTKGKAKLKLPRLIIMHNLVFKRKQKALSLVVHLGKIQIWGHPFQEEGREGVNRYV